MRSEGNASAVSETGRQEWPGALQAKWVGEADRGLFFPSRLSEPSGLQEGVGYHRHQGMAVKSGPGSSFKVIQAQFFLELLMRLPAHHHFRFPSPQLLKHPGRHRRR